jgi:hypothetical protein
VSFHVVDSYHGYTHTLLDDRFEMRRPTDAFRRDIRCEGEVVLLTIECTASTSADPSEIVARLFWERSGVSETLFRIDAQGIRGEAPSRGRTYAYYAGPMRVEIEIHDFELGGLKPWQLRRIEWIRFDVRVFDD